MKIAFYINDDTHIENMRKSMEWLQIGETKPSIDYFHKMDALRAIARKKRYDLIYILAGLKLQEELEAIEGLRKYDHDCLVILVSGDVKSRYWYYHGKFIRSFNRQKVALDIKDIYCLQSYGRTTYVHTSDKKMRVTTNLNEEEEKLPAGHFARINQGAIINLQYVKEVEDREIIMANGQRHYISYRRKKSFLEQYWKYAMGSRIH